MTANRDLLFKAAYQQIDQGYPRPRSEEAAPNFNYDQHNPLRSTAPADRPLTLVATTDDYESFSRYRLLESRLHVAAIDEHGELSLSRRIANDPGSVLELFGCSAAFAGETQVPVEATYGWEWLAELLEDAGYEPDLAHLIWARRHSPARPGSRHKRELGEAHRHPRGAHGRADADQNRAYEASSSPRGRAIGYGSPLASTPRR